MARLTKLSLLLILNYTTRLITHSLATTPHLAKNATNAGPNPITVCSKTDDWIRPSWVFPEIDLTCQILMNDLRQSQPEIHRPNPPRHEFLPRGMVPAYPDLANPVRTPWRIKRGKWIHLERGSFAV